MRKIANVHGVKTHFCEIMRNNFIGFNSRRLHHLEDCEKKSFVLRMARLVSASKSKGFLKETVKV